MNLQLELSQFKREFFQKFPPEKAAIMQGATQALAKEFQNRRALRIDDEAPNFLLQNTDGQQISLYDKLNQGAVILCFYFGSWCPYCNLELRAYQGLLPKIQALGASVLAISPQTIDASRKTALNNALSFDVLSDSGCTVARDYGVVFEISDPLRLLYTELGHALPDYNGTEDWLLPVPATFIIDRRHHIALAHIDVDYTKRYEPADAIAILLSLFVAA
ncbi:putative bacterioferritin comigratory protein [Planktothrix agardhii CCAP 1459/11A]|uniref:thioredoxin-dependent peroxiredoxin n=1 Tax=Planktothrix agardhii CCAP 1459/11A TaxID=282420 RepID=A0A479ZUI3_PLAAG|nr:peroxiredoxin-like family protein [Planktothrix agardhii]GCL34868.1 putative bacterioferritin comigratory protein [Planktothrix agardhii CCAP 1459/11A]CAH2574437.1 Thiol-disulfide oxidoreductase ResA [Planktothrix rubescens]